MLILSKILAWLVGPGLATVTGPAVILTLVISLHHNWKAGQEAHDKKIETAAVQQCQQSWMVAMSKSREKAASLREQEARSLVEAERRINEGLSNDLENLRTEIEQVRSAAAGTDDKCLSDSVLDALGRRQGVDRSGQSPRPARSGSRNQ